MAVYTNCYKLLSANGYPLFEKKCLSFNFLPRTIILIIGSSKYSYDTILFCCFYGWIQPNITQGARVRLNLFYIKIFVASYYNIGIGTNSIFTAKK